MMIRPALLVALCFAVSAPAHAGLRATYGSPENAQALVVEVGDDGDVRIGEQGSNDYGLLKKDGFYIVGSREGAATVARTADIAAAIDRVIEPIFGDALTRTSAPAPRAKMRAEAKGARTVGDQAGRVYAVYGLDQTQPETAIDYVMSSDPALKPVGRALEQYMHAALLPNASILGTAAAELIEETRFIFALGTPIDGGGRFALRKLEKADLPAGHFALPVKPITVDALAAEMRAALPKP